MEQPIEEQGKGYDRQGENAGIHDALSERFSLMNEEWKYGRIGGDDVDTEQWGYAHKDRGNQISLAADTNERPYEECPSGYGGIRIHGDGIHLRKKHGSEQRPHPAFMCDMSDKLHAAKKKDEAEDRCDNAIYLLTGEER